MKPFFVACSVLAAPSLAAGQLALPDGARQVSERITEFGTYQVPLAEFDGDKVPTLALEGHIGRRSWRVPGGAMTPLQTLDPIRRQIADDGFEIMLDCADITCGGFDFRFGIEMIPAPDMHVDIRSFRFLSALKGNESAVTVMVSQAGADTYIQVIQVAPGDEPPIVTEINETVITPELGVKQALTTDGRAILSGLDFGTGADALGTGPYSDLSELAEILESSPDIRIALVGHTDTIGTLERNIALGKRRAEAVKAHLVEQYGIDVDRIEAEGAGYLAPLTSNISEAGRESNRRVEAVLLTQN
ncbi:OmpA family protein [Primorskyibacter sp. S87]|uniref:OmpA family protein n=1 Tax=Primorskyibacter sp. S87 TaxID=3415126 RepID=UPI003C79D217